MREKATAAGNETQAPGGIAPQRFSLINSIKFWGGSERFIFDLASGLQAKNLEVMIYGRPGKEFLRRTAAAGLPSIPLYVNFDYDPRPLLKLPPFSGKEIFVAVTPRDLKLLRLLAFFRPQAKFFWYLGVCFPVDNWEYRWLLKKESIRLIAACDFLKSEIVSRVPQVTNRISVLPSGVDIPAVDSAAARRKLAEKYRLSPQNFFLGMFSRLVAGKGHSLVLNALKQVRDKGTNFHLWILGMGEQEGLEKEVAQLALADCVTIAGYQTDITPWMAGVDAVLLPSEKESFPYAVLEAMALGKTALASKVGGLPEMIQHGVDGVVLPPKEPEAWARCIIELAQNPQRREELGWKAKAKVENRFSQERMIANFLKIVDADSAVDSA